MNGTTTQLQHPAALEAALTAITLIACTSSQIHAYGYDPESRTLALQFKRKGEDGTRIAGSIYEYDEVPPELYAEFCAAESKGIFFGARIKNAGFKFRKLEPKPVEAEHGVS